MKIIFILGSGHCGSTLLDLMLDSHSRIIGLGQCEKIGVKDNCACGKNFKECNFWKNIVDYNDLFYKAGIYNINRTKKDFLINKNNYLLKTENKTNLTSDGYILANEKMFEKALNISGAKIIVDSSKNPDRVEILSKSKKIEPIILHLVRDGRGVSWSYFKKKAHRKNKFPYMWKWFVSNIKVEFLRKRNGIPYIFINYSNLVKSPEKELRKILKEVNLEYEHSMLKFRQGQHHQAAGNRLRLGGSEELKEDLEWKHKFPFKYRIIFNLLFGWLNFYYNKKK